MIDVPKTDAKRFEEPPLSWKPAYYSEGIIPVFTCPGGSTGTLRGWIVNKSGEVSPSVDCRCGCGFHDYIKLLDWKP